MKKMLLIGLLLMICACGKEGPSPEQASDTISSKPKQSIFKDSALDFAVPDKDGLAYTQPEEVLKKIEETLAGAKGEAAEPALLAMRGLVQSQLDKNDAAFEDLTAALRARPDAELYALRSFVLWRGGKMRGAVRDAEYALLKDANSPIATMTQGLVFLSENNLNEACLKLKDACEQGQCYGQNYAQSQGQCN